ncbi:hypothetical protein [Streptomyces sp. CoH17]|uniref:hypothetical protein n=1 Tax=Streptomyces sp. CoH17 TaxID=2992806 RepID=UPI0022704663|nr:hypothetical protein [Streptomyces sp. CoH17]
MADFDLTEIAKCDPDQVIKHEGQNVKIRDLPEQELRALMGYGHHMATAKLEKREVVAHPSMTGSWAYKPEECLIAGSQKGTWIESFDGTQYLVCPGCGLDGT